MSPSPTEPLHHHRVLQLTLANLVFPGKMSQNELHLKRLFSASHAIIFSDILEKQNKKQN